MDDKIELITRNRDLFDTVAIEYMKAYVMADPTVGYYDVANRSFDFAKCFLEIRENHIKP